MTRAFLRATLVLASFAGCASERASFHQPAASPNAADSPVPLDPTNAYLVQVRSTFARLSSMEPAARESALADLAALPVPESLAAEDRDTLQVEIDRERALAAFDADRAAEAVVAIERALATAEAVPRRDVAFTAGLLLTAEVVYARAGRDEAARWAHDEAAVLLGRDAGP